MINSQTCIKRSKEEWPYKTGDHLKEIQFI
jgi:hypothetical protein